MDGWLKIGDWVLNVSDVVAVYYEQTPDGPRLEVFTGSGGELFKSRIGGFTALGHEAEALWHYFTTISTDLLSTDDPVLAHRRVRA